MPLPLQNFVDQKGPVVSAAWLNQVDATVTTGLGGNSTPAAILAFLGLTPLTFPIPVTQGGTGSSTGVNSYYYGIDTGLVNAYTIAVTGLPVTLVSGMIILFRPINTNTGPATIAVNGGTATAIISATTGAPLTGGEIQALTALQWNGTNWTWVENSISGFIPRTAGEVAASVIPVNYGYAPGILDRYAVNTTPGTTDMSAALQNACAANQLVTLLPNSTYLVAGVTIASSVMIQGAGFGSILLDKTTTLAHGTYSQAMITSTTAVDYITFKDLTIDGGCSGPSSSLDSSEVPIVKITATDKVRFDKVKLTRYCGAYGGIPKAISASFWEAIVIQNASKTEFLNCYFTQNHYEMVLIWNAPGSNNVVLIDGCVESNTGTPDSHTAFDINGGHVTVTNCSWNNTGATSQLDIQVAQSVRVANNYFGSMQAGSAAQCNIGQDVFPYNSDVLVENNYFINANSAAIALGQGSSQIIRGNVIDTPLNYGIKVTAGVTNFSTFLTEYPEWPAPSASGSNSIIISDNIINGVNNSGSISKAIYFHTVNQNAGYWFKDVQIRGNTVTAGSAPNNTLYGIALDDMQDLIVKDNWLQYTTSGLYFESILQNFRIEGNTFSSIPPNANSDIIWVGAFNSVNGSIRDNQFDNYPVGTTPNINVFAGTVTPLEIIDNFGIHPTRAVAAGAATTYTLYQTLGIRVTAAPAAGDFALGDVVKNVPTTAQPGEYICTTPGSFGSVLSCTATGTSPNIFFTCSAIGQLHVGQHVAITGAGPSGATLTCTVVYITGSTFYVDQVISTSVTGAAMSLVNPTFVKSANYT